MDSGYLFKGIRGFEDIYIDTITYDDYKFLYTVEEWDNAVATADESVIDQVADAIINIGNNNYNDYDYIVVEARSNSGTRIPYIYNCYSRRYDYNEENSYKYLYRLGEPKYNKIAEFLKNKRGTI